jgi:hypothetical protein
MSIPSSIFIIEPNLTDPRFHGFVWPDGAWRQALGPYALSAFDRTCSDFLPRDTCESTWDTDRHAKHRFHRD